MIVLSLFDGLSCARIAFERAGISVSKYYASEIDKYAIQVSKKNYPDIIQLGDITKWKEWNIEQPDIIIGGSPCTNFSFAGKRKGMSTTCEIKVETLEQYLELKKNNFEFEGQSYLFWEYTAILKHYKPKYFLLENVRMAKDWENIISLNVGVQPVLINSSLVSAQNRLRNYWTNINARKDLFGGIIHGIEQPKNKKIYLKDIIESGKSTEEMTSKGKAWCLTARYSGATAWNSIEKHQKTMIKYNATAPNGKLIEISKNTKTPFMLTEIRTKEGKKSRKKERIKTGRDTNKRNKDHKKYIPNDTGKANCLMTGHGDMLSQVFDKCLQVGKADTKGYDQRKRVYSENGKCLALSTCQGGGHEPKIAINGFNNFKTSVQKDNVIIMDDIYKNRKKRYYTKKSPTLKMNCSRLKETTDNITWRKLAPIECERLQTIPDNFTNHVSNSQRYKILGNSFTCDVIVHILKHICHE